MIKIGTVNGDVIEAGGVKNVTNHYYGEREEQPSKDLTLDAGTEGVPEVLAGSELWQRVKAEGMVDEAGQPTVSRTEAALLADMLAVKLGIRNKWKTFEAMWHRNNMRGDYNTALNQNKSLAFQDKLKNLLR